VDKLRGSRYEVFPMSRRNGLDLLSYNSTVENFNRVKPDVIINCATHVGSVHYVTEYAADVFFDNALMILNIYKAVKNNLNETLIVNPIANCCYPSGPSTFIESDLFNGDVHNSVYGFGHTRRMLVAASKVFNNQYNIRSHNFIIPNAFGPGDSIDPNKTHALNGMIIRMIKSKINKEKEFIVWGSGKPVREWAYVDDIADVLIKSLDLLQSQINPVNFARSKGHSIGDSAKIIAELLNYNGRIVFDNSYQDGSLLKVMDNFRFNKLFPNFKFFDHKDGIKNVIDYYNRKLLK